MTMTKKLTCYKVIHENIYKENLQVGMPRHEQKQDFSMKAYCEKNIFEDMK
jgi:hypothetical protein